MIGFGSHERIFGDSYYTLLTIEELGKKPQTPHGCPSMHSAPPMGRGFDSRENVSRV
jgi:hypothetical protein